MLVDAKRAFDDAMAGGKLNVDRRAAAERQLSICEGSDWFWWFGDYNPADTVSDFERLYRAHLTTLYSLIGTPAPAYLTETFTHGSGAPATGGVMRKGQSD
jgi:alpha-amylase/alpha-mannosidase (GH57 family)